MESFLTTLMTTLFGGLLGFGQQDREFNQQSQLLGNQQEFTREREDLAYQRQRPQTIYNDYLDAGFNPNLAAQAVMGGNAETASTGGSPSAPTVNSAVDALTRTIGQGGQQMFDKYLQEAQIKNLEANTNKTDVESGLMPRDFALRKMSTQAQIKVWNASIERIGKQNQLDDQLIEKAKLENMYYGKMSEAQLKVYQSEIDKNVADAALAYQKVSESQKYEEVLDADILLKESERELNIQSTKESAARTVKTFEESERERIAKEFEEKMSGIPMTVDDRKMMIAWAEKGEYDKIQQYFTVVLQGAASQTFGEALGTPAKKSSALPLKLWSSERYDFGKTLNGGNRVYWNYPLTY